MKKNRLIAMLSIVLMASVMLNIYLAVEKEHQEEFAAAQLKLVQQKQAELAVFESKFEESVSVAKASYARAEAQLEEAKKKFSETE